MAKTWTIRTLQNSPEEVSGYAYSIGKGKRAVGVLGVRSYETESGPVYQIDHIPTGYMIMDGYPFLSLARSVAQSLIDTLGSELLEPIPEKLRRSFSEDLLEYMKFYRLKEVKTALPFEEFIHGIDYENLKIERDYQRVLEQQEAELSKELCDGDKTLGWVPDKLGTLSASQLRALVEGRETDL